MSDSAKKRLALKASRDLLSALILNSDRILIRLMIGVKEVTVFYLRLTDGCRPQFHRRKIAV